MLQCIWMFFIGQKELLQVIILFLSDMMEPIDRTLVKDGYLLPDAAMSALNNWDNSSFFVKEDNPRDSLSIGVSTCCKWVCCLSCTLEKQVVKNLGVSFKGFFTYVANVFLHCCYVHHICCIRKGFTMHVTRQNFERLATTNGDLLYTHNFLLLEQFSMLQWIRMIFYQIVERFVASEEKEHYTRKFSFMLPWLDEPKLIVLSRLNSGEGGWSSSYCDRVGLKQL